jgi:hypothetical protein
MDGGTGLAGICLFSQILLIADQVIILINPEKKMDNHRIFNKV